jgi:hypothetical protein
MAEEEVVHGITQSAQVKQTAEGPQYDEIVVTPPAHQRPANLDPRTNGPYLDEIHMEEQRARAEARNG